jgi:hypothetical protein
MYRDMKLNNVQRNSYSSGDDALKRREEKE